TCVLAGIHVHRVRPDAMLLVAVLAGLVAGPEKGAVTGFVAGLLADLTLQTPFGLSALVLSLVGFGVGMLQTGILRTSWWIPPGPFPAGPFPAGGPPRPATPRARLPCSSSSNAEWAFGTCCLHDRYAARAGDGARPPRHPRRRHRLVVRGPVRPALVPAGDGL